MARNLRKRSVLKRSHILSLSLLDETTLGETRRLSNIELSKNASFERVRRGYDSSDEEN